MRVLAGLLGLIVFLLLPACADDGKATDGSDGAESPAMTETVSSGTTTGSEAGTDTATTGSLTTTGAEDVTGTGDISSSTNASTTSKSSGTDGDAEEATATASSTSGEDSSDSETTGGDEDSTSESEDESGDDGGSTETTSGTSSSDEGNDEGGVGDLGDDGGTTSSSSTSSSSTTGSTTSTTTTGTDTTEDTTGAGSESSDETGSDDGGNDLASELDPTIPSSFAKDFAFIYQGDGAMQQGMDPEEIDPARQAILHGEVRDMDGNPLPGVAVSALGHPEYGVSTSQDDGRFFFVVNGGGRFVLSYALDGYLPSQRALPTNWQEFGALETVVLVELDPNPTVVDLTDPSLTVAAGSKITDADGERQAVVMFPPGNIATMKLPEGSEQELSTITVRATEYTVGENGPEAMPGELPANSGYTYAVELSIDEAITAGADRVEFDVPVPFYLENFLQFPAGTIVPAGYYDRNLADWVPSQNGLVVEILSIDAGVAVLDLDGSGLPASPDDLATLDISIDELEELATRYLPGQTLWRVPISHFTPWDCNWPWTFDDDAWALLDEMWIDDPELLEDPCLKSGSIIDCQNRSLGESIGISGTPFSLVYNSDRTRGITRHRELKIQLSGSDVPESLLRIELKVSIAGKVFEKSFEPESNLSTTYLWDGRDGFEREWYGSAVANVEVRHVFQAVPVEPAEFSESFRQGSETGARIGSSRVDGTVSLTSNYTAQLRGLGTHAAAEKFGGWTIDAHHIFDVERRRVYLGNGSESDDSEIGKVTDLVAEIETDDYEPAIAAAANGDVFVAQNLSTGGDYGLADDIVIERIRLDGTSSVFYDGPGPEFGMDPSLFLALDGGAVQLGNWEGELLRIDDAGEVTPVDLEFDPAFVPENASPIEPVTCSNGDFYALGVDQSSEIAACVLRLQANGATEVVVGDCDDPSDEAVPMSDGVWARDIRFGYQRPFLFCDQEAKLHLLQEELGVFTLRGNGRLAQLAPEFPEIEGGWISRIQLAPDNDVVYSVRNFDEDTSHVERYDWQSGKIIADFGKKFRDDLVGLRDGGVALRTSVEYVNSFHWDGGGNLLVSNMEFGRCGGFRCRGENKMQIARVVPAFSWQRDDRIYTLSKDGALRYVFSEQGKHLQTVNALTDAVLLEFAHDAEGLLVSITDADGEVTVIERGSDGQATAIVSHDGQRTDLSVDAQGDLRSVINPAGEEIKLEYDNGLLIKFTNPRGHSSEFNYHLDGSIDRDTDAVGGYSELTLTDERDLETVALVSAMGRITRYVTDKRDENAGVRTVIQPDGTQSISTLGKDGVSTTQLADGTLLSREQSPDPRYGMKAPYVSRAETLLPSGIQTVALQSRELEEDASGNLVSISETTDLNGRVATAVYDAASRTETATTPEGRQGRAVTDDQGRIMEVHSDGLASIYYTRDDRGRVTSVTVGEGADARTTSYDYFENGPAKGYLESLTDPLGRQVTYTRDAVGRILELLRPDAEVLGFDYDPNGNSTGITPAGRSEHGFSYTPVDLVEDYTPPAIGPWAPETVSQYNLDRQLELTTLPSGEEIEFVYDPDKRRIDQVIDPLGTTSYTFDPVSGKVLEITGQDGAKIGYAYDGPNLTAVTWTGEVSGSADVTFDENGWLTSRRVNGNSEITFDHDDDGLLTRAGSLTLTRNPVHGLLDATALEKTTSSHEFSQFSELELLEYSFNGSELFSVEITERDKLGRIKTKSETVEGSTTEFAFTYDEIGRLTEVWEDGTRTETFDYDPNGNRLPGSTDGQDRLLAWGDITFTYNNNGDLETRTDDGQVTEFDYDVFGGLRGVSLPDGTEISYMLDPTGRRIGKKIDGVLARAWLYADALNPIAELDTDGSLVSRFIYASQGHVPDYMVKDGKTWRLLTDERGSVRIVINSETGEVGQRLNYDVWGRVVEDTSPGFQPFAFAGGLYDPDTGLIRFGARDYDPETGRWTTKDPIGFDGGYNHYAYAGNDPVNAIDRTGLLADALLDIALIAYDLYRIGADNVFGDCGNLGENLASLGGNIIGLAIVGATGVGLAARAAYKAKNATRAAPQASQILGKICFAAGTLVETSEGKKAIEDVEVGDLVWSKDQQTGEEQWERVSATFVSTTETLLQLEFRVNDSRETEIVRATPSHPFWSVHDGDWNSAGELMVGEEVETRLGNVELLSKTSFSGPVDVYNLEVENSHTYFVGEAGMWVHNTCFPNATKLGEIFKTKNWHALKKEIVKDAKSFAEQIGAKNPDIGISETGHIVLRNQQTQATIVTDLLADWFLP